MCEGSRNAFNQSRKTHSVIIFQMLNIPHFGIKSFFYHKNIKIAAFIVHYFLTFTAFMKCKKSDGALMIWRLIDEKVCVWITYDFDNSECISKEDIIVLQLHK